MRDDFNGNAYASFSGSPMEIGPEIKFNAPQLGFSAAFRHFHEVLNNGSNAGQYYPNVFALTVSQRF